MPAIKDIGSITKKWAEVTPQRTQYYEEGVRVPKKDWEREALAAEDAYREGVTRAANEGRFGRGVSAAGTTKWQQKASTVGVQRWGPGVQVADDAYNRGFAPYRDVIERTDLPPRYPRGDRRNMERAATIAMALAEARQASM